jgi:hypothetical protein
MHLLLSSDADSVSGAAFETRDPGQTNSRNGYRTAGSPSGSAR